MWYVILAVVALDAAWLVAAGIPVVGYSFLRVSLATVLLPSLAWIYRDRAPRLAEMASTALPTIVFSAAAGVLSYLAASTNLPFVDAQYAAIDESLGLDWRDWYAWVNSHPVLKLVLRIAYDSVGPEIILCLIVLPLVGHAKVVREFQWMAIISLLLIIPISELFPATGPWVVYEVGEPTPWLDHVLAMRSHAMPLDLTALTGIIVCPSFHTTLGLLLIYSARFNRVVLACSTVLNGLMIVSVPSEGSHYFIDVIAGAIVAVIAIMVVRMPRMTPISVQSAFVRG